MDAVKPGPLRLSAYLYSAKTPPRLASTRHSIPSFVIDCLGLDIDFDSVILVVSKYSKPPVAALRSEPSMSKLIAEETTTSRFVDLPK